MPPGGQQYNQRPIHPSQLQSPPQMVSTLSHGSRQSIHSLRGPVQPRQLPAPSVMTSPQGQQYDNEFTQFSNPTQKRKRKKKILALMFTHKTSQLTICVTTGYLPPENSPWGRDAEFFCSNLLTLIYNLECDNFILCGELNSRIGSLHDYVENVDDIPPRIVIDNHVNQHQFGGFSAQI